MASNSDKEMFCPDVNIILVFFTSLVADGLFLFMGLLYSFMHLFMFPLYSIHACKLLEPLNKYLFHAKVLL